MIKNSKTAKKVMVILMLVIVIGLAVQSIILVGINTYIPVKGMHSAADMAEIAEMRFFFLNLKYKINALSLDIFYIGSLLVALCLIKYKFTFSFREILFAFLALLVGAAIVTVPFAMFDKLYAVNYLNELYTDMFNASIVFMIICAINFVLWLRKGKKI